MTRAVSRRIGSTAQVWPSNAADLGVPADTVRDWIRWVRARAEWLSVQGTIAAHRLDPMLPAIVSAGPARARQHDDGHDTMTTPNLRERHPSALYVVTESDALIII